MTSHAWLQFGAGAGPFQTVRVPAKGDAVLWGGRWHRVVGGFADVEGERVKVLADDQPDQADDLDRRELEDTPHDGATRYAITRRLRDETDEALRLGNLQAAGELTKRLVAYIGRQTKAGPYRGEDGAEHRIEDMIGPDGCAPRRRYSVAVRGIVRELRALDPEAAAAAACWARDPYAGEVSPVVVTDLQTAITSRWTVAPRVTWEPRALDQGEEGEP